MEQTTNRECNLITDMPIEIVKKYTTYLDLKSLVMFNCVCKLTNDADMLRQRQIQELEGMVNGIINLSKEVLNCVTTEEGQNRLLANILRKLIFTSMSDPTSVTNQSLASSQALTEYNSLYEMVIEEVDTSVNTFNELLEDAQFEFRGFSIINIPPSRRDNLNKVKEVIRQRYFSKPFTVHTYCTFDETCMELNSNITTAMFDIHRHTYEDDLEGMMFLYNKVSAFVSNNKYNTLVQSFEESVRMVESMFHWDIHDVHAVAKMTTMMMFLMDCQPFYNGSTDVCIEVWNDVAEENWIFSHVINEVVHGMYPMVLKDITDNCMLAFDSYAMLL